MSAAKTRGHRRKHKKHGGAHEEEHENHERWLVSYADMMTLLMVLFIVMFAISAVDQKKFAQLKTGLAVGFGAESAAFDESGNQLQQEESSTPFDSAANAPGKPNPQSQSTSQAKSEPDVAKDQQLQQAVAQAAQNADRAKQSKQAQDVEKEVENFEEIKKKILQALAGKGMADIVKFSIDERGLVVTIVTSSVVFAGDRADLQPAGRTILDGVGPALAALPNHIEVDGHTNQLPIATVNYPSGWELSTARASSVVRYLHDKEGIGEDRMFAAGFADTRPMYPATDSRAAALNRRVEIVVLSTLPADERALLPTTAGKNE
jgi:chemotaxis protein MotB